MMTLQIYVMALNFMGKKRVEKLVKKFAIILTI